MNDIEIKCVDCQSEFVFTESEQEFYKDKGFENPKRCKKCRIAKKARNH